MCITESHLCPEILDSEIHIKNWISHRSDTINREKGGVVIYTKENILTTNHFEFSNSYCDILGLYLPNQNQVITTIYRPPLCPIQLFNEGLEKLDKWLSDISTDNIPPHQII